MMWMLGLAVLVAAIFVVVVGFRWLNKRWDQVDSYYEREHKDALPSDVSSWPSGDRGV